jgi:DNA-binding transcriptional LysR family regulator
MDVSSGSAETSVVVGGRAAGGVAHLGVAITSEWNFAPELAAGIVRPVLLDWDLPTLELRAVFPTGRMASAKTREFVSFVESCIPAANYEPLNEPAAV